MTKDKAKRRKRMIGNIIRTIVFCIFLGVFLYPTFSDLWTKYRTQQLEVQYNRAVEDKSQKVLDKEYKRAQEYNRKHPYNYMQQEPFGAENYKLKAPYKNILNINGDGVMGMLTVPSINIKLPIYHGIGDKALSQGCGHVEQTALPVGGKGEHTVLAAHRGLANARLFTDLDKVKKGDKFYLSILGHTLAYEVDQIKVVLPDNTKYISAVPGKDYVTLLTCTPYAINTHRLLVRGHRIKLPKEAKKQQKTDLLGRNFYIKVGIALALLVVFMIIIWGDERRARRKKNRKKRKQAQGK